MIDGTRPGIFMSFDDWHESEWVDYLPTLAAHNVRATFYSCLTRGLKLPPFDIATISPDYWTLLHALADAGHTVGYHTVNHYVMGELLRGPETERVIEAEIFTGVREFLGGGLGPRHFAYPGGKHNPYIDGQLLEIFDTVRTIVPEDTLGGMRYYTPAQLASEQVLIAYDLKYPHAFDALARTISGKAIGMFFAHNPKDYGPELDWLFDIAENAGAIFYPMSELEGRN